MKTWRTPTRRAWVAMIGAAAAALVIERPVREAIRAAAAPSDDDVDRPRSTWAGTTRWIGHC
ncbi:MAG TPA: hypothetical protein VFP84_11115 [Kofleriaceae bacterium]|nr:hypothetical protein [Kofleriaceae bacterium]